MLASGFTELETGPPNDYGPHLIRWPDEVRAGATRVDGLARLAGETVQQAREAAAQVVDGDALGVLRDEVVDALTVGTVPAHLRQISRHPFAAIGGQPVAAPDLVEALAADGADFNFRPRDRRRGRRRPCRRPGGVPAPTSATARFVIS